MCEWGNTARVRVKIPADLACEAIEKWKDAKIDSCIAPLVGLLQQGGIDMRGSCCGHGAAPGDIHLQDGRVLIVLDKERGRKYLISKRSKGKCLESCR
jgi:hypothetical protein